MRVRTEQTKATLTPLLSNTKPEIATAIPGRSFAAIRSYLTNLDNLILFGILITLFFMPLHEKLKAAGFWITLGTINSFLVEENNA